MAGVVLETLSNRKLIVFGVALLLIQIGFFLIGGLVGESIAVITGPLVCPNPNPDPTNFNSNTTNYSSLRITYQHVNTHNGC